MTADDLPSQPSPSSKAFAARLARFAYTPDPTDSPTRARGSRPPASPLKQEASRSEESPRKRVQLEEEGSGDEELQVGRKRKAVAGPKVVKQPRGYAAPEVYEHLRPINDLLGENLDVVFCGIKYPPRCGTCLPLAYTVHAGKTSSGIGHHFAHPTNKFWRSVHQSGFTPRLLDAREDHLLLTEYRCGLTNLVDRPTSEQSELSTLEMRLNISHLLGKFQRDRPLCVCFVGKKIWDVFEGVVKKTARRVEGAPREVAGEEAGLVKMETEDDDNSRLPIKAEPPDPITPTILSPSPRTPSKRKAPSTLPTSTPTPSPSPSRGKRKPAAPKVPFDFARPRPYWLAHPPEEVKTEGEDDGLGGKGPVYTYFWVVPSTSGLERTTLPEGLVNFISMKSFVERLKSGEQPAPTGEGEGGWLEIDPQGVEGTVDEMRRAGSAKEKGLRV
ncbi:hypothetical protein IAT38_003608 [Cryptococcus sp. DSM 104549]